MRDYAVKSRSLRGTDAMNEFERFPHRKISFGFGRRHFFKGFAQEILAIRDAVASRPVFSLADLGMAENEKLGDIVPVIRQEMDFLDDPEEVRCSFRSSNQTITLFKRSSPALSAFNYMNGQNTLRQIAATLAVENHWPQDESFKFVRGLFLTLVEARVCLPKNSLPSPA
jgi:hypothetical protein